MPSSSRNLPENFATGLDVSGTRIERNLTALVGKLAATPPALVSAKGTASYLMWGYSPNQVSGDCLPWLRENNSPTSVSSFEPATTFLNPYRHKGIQTPGIDPGVIGEGDLWTWEVSFAPAESCLLDSIEVTLMTGPPGGGGSFYTNDFKAGASPPPGKVAGAWLNDCTVSVLTDDQLNNTDRKASAVEGGSFKASLGANLINVNAINPALDTMQPPLPTALAEIYGIEFSIPCNILVPRNTPVRICITIPEYPGAIDTGWVGLDPWDKQVWTCMARLVRPNLEA